MNKDKKPIPAPINPVVLYQLLAKEKNSLSATTSQMTTIVTNAFDFAAEQAVEVANQLVKSEKLNEKYKTIIQSLEAQLKKAKEAKNKRIK